MIAIKSNYAALCAGVGLLVAGLIGTVTGCGREQRQGASHINQHLSGSPAPLNDGYSRGLSVTPAPYNMNTNMNTNTGPGTRPTGGEQIEISQKIADAVAGLNEVKSANVLVMGRSAYVAVVLHYGSAITNGADASTNNRQIVDVSDQLKTKIAGTAKSIDSRIDNVYVSANPDFVERVNSYAQDIRNGKPVSGFIKEFYNVVERLFPTRAGANNPPAAPSGR